MTVIKRSCGLDILLSPFVYVSVILFFVQVSFDYSRFRQFVYNVTCQISDGCKSKVACAWEGS